MEADACVMATPTRATEATPITLTSWSVHVNITHAAANARLAVQDLSRRNGSRQGQTKSSCVNVSYDKTFIVVNLVIHFLLRVNKSEIIRYKIQA